jgi:BirA family biotin operon repressor/biotin-[acetyl-CoA-carboxylase] ligase
MDLQRLHQALAADAGRFGSDPSWQAIRPRFKVHLYDSLPSTNSQLWQLANTGAGAGTVVIARQQHAGKGQRGRQWHSPPGGLYLSLLLEPDWPVAQAAQLTFASAWGVATALNQLGLAVRLKWPNDLVVGHRKLGGILTETRIESDRIATAIVGVGLNWSNPVPDTGITLSELLAQPPVKPLTCLEELAAVTLRGLWQGICDSQRLGGKVFMKAYQQLLTHLGQSVMLAGAWGRVVGVSEDGRLQVQMTVGPGRPTAQLVHVGIGDISLGYNGLV